MFGAVTYECPLLLLGAIKRRDFSKSPEKAVRKEQASKDLPELFALRIP